MNWAYRRDLRKGDSAHGITFHMWERTGRNVRAEATTRMHKLHLGGKASITVAEDQYKYGDEVIAQLYGEQQEAKPRHSGKHFRHQIYLGPADEATAQMLEDVAAHIRRRINETR